MTGATRGIGQAIADQLRSSGAKVICSGTNPSKSSHDGKQYWPLDLTDEKSLQDFIGRLKKLPSLDILINNAGINKIDPIDKISQGDWDKIIKVNLTGAMRLMQEAAAFMIKTKTAGRILNISSIFGIVSHAKRNAYSASKTGLIGLTRASALDLASHNILVNCLCPGFVLTDLTRSILSAEEIGDLSRQVPLARFGSEEEIARAAAFLCSDWNTYMTGQTLVIDGGYITR